MTTKYPGDQGECSRNQEAVRVYDITQNNLETLWTTPFEFTNLGK